MDLCLTIAIHFSLTLLAAAVTSISKFCLTLNDCHQDAFLSSLEDLSKNPSPGRFGSLTRLIGTYTVVLDGDESAVTAATDPDDIICADGIDVGTVSSRATHAIVRINNLLRVPDWKGQTAELYKQVSLRMKREILTTHTQQRHLENESVESLSTLTGDSHSDHVIRLGGIRRTRSA
jgi:hypothetical protein